MGERDHQRRLEPKPSSNGLFHFSQRLRVDESHSPFEFDLRYRTQTLRVECSIRHATSFVTHFVLSIAQAGRTDDIADDCPLLTLMATLKTRTGRTFAAKPRSAIQISPRLALGTALVLLSVVHSEQRFRSADCRSVFFNPIYQCAQFV